MSKQHEILSNNAYNLRNLCLSVIMQIKTVDTVKNIFDEATMQKIFNQLPRYLLVNNSQSDWFQNMSSQLEEVKDDNELLAIALIVTHTTSPRIDSICLICPKKDISPAFLAQIDHYINRYNHCSIIRFLGEQWTKDNAKFPLTFMWTTRLDGGYTLISDRAVAPAYQRQGLMKTISLNLIGHLEQIYGYEHELQAIPIHPATYRFFNPQDKTLKFYEAGDLQNMKCEMLLKIHQRKVTTAPAFTISPEVMASLIAQGFLKVSGKSGKDDSENEDNLKNNGMD